MNERYRWNEEQERRRAEARAERARREREQDQDLSGRDYYGVSGPRRDDDLRGQHARGDRPNRSWDGREPYPMDVGGVNRPGEDRGPGLDPLTGDRGSGERDGPRSSHAGYGYRGVQYGDEAVGQRGGPSPAWEAGQASGGRGRYLEGGYEPRSFREDDDELEHEARSWWARARDEFRAWMGDREAERRVRRDHAEHERYGRRGGDWHGHDDDTGWRDPISDDDARRFDNSPREHRPGMFRDDRDRW